VESKELLFGRGCTAPSVCGCGIWYVVKDGTVVALLVTEAVGRLAEPVAVVPMIDYGRAVNDFEEAEHMAATIARAPNAAPDGCWFGKQYDQKPKDLRSVRGGRMPYCLPHGAGFVAGPFVGQWFDDGRTLVCSLDDTEPASPPDEQSLPIAKVRGRYRCPHCQKPFKLLAFLGNHLRNFHFDGMTASQIAGTPARLIAG
jgi:hypothetical protein